MFISVLEVFLSHKLLQHGLPETLHCFILGEGASNGRRVGFHLMKNEINIFLIVVLAVQSLQKLIKVMEWCTIFPVKHEFCKTTIITDKQMRIFDNNHPRKKMRVFRNNKSQPCLHKMSSQQISCNQVQTYSKKDFFSFLS